MNIGLFTDTYYPQISGVTTSVRILEKELNKLGHRVYIFTTTDPEVEYSLPRVFRLPSMPFVFFPERRFTFVYPPRLLVNLKSLKLDIVHTQTEFSIGIFGKIVAEYNRIPIVHTYHTMYQDYVHYIAGGHLVTPNMVRKLTRIVCNRTQEVIAPSEKTRDYLTELGVVRPINTVPTGMDFAQFAKANFTAEQVAKTKASLGIGETDPVIVTVGRVAKEKSMDVLVRQMPELLADMPGLKLLIVGDGPVRAGLEDLAGYLGVRNSVIFAGAVPWDKVALYYQLGDVFANACTTDTQGLTYVEAIAGGIPVIVKTDKAVEGVISHRKTGFCFERDEDAASVMRYALNHPEEAKAVSERAIKAVDYLSAARFAQNVEEIYERAIADKNEKKGKRVRKSKRVKKNKAAKKVKIKRKVRRKKRKSEPQTPENGIKD
ncbi:MAG: glycosyltransferase family 4 protein [Defluviitaleaceae bacterium]|nr:glycosyltransferase family 4 protein [Defluviitaleaceae bacterium]